GALAMDLRGAATGVFEGVHLAVEHDAPALHPPIVAAPEDPTAVHEHRADGNPPLGQTALGLLDCGSEELVHVAPRPRAPARDQITLSGWPAVGPPSPPAVRGTHASGAMARVNRSARDQARRPAREPLEG